MSANTGPLYFPGAGGVPFSKFVQQGGDAISYPMAPYQTQARIITQIFLGLRVSYIRPADNQPMPGNPSFFFCNDSPLQDEGAGLSRFTRTWANVPKAWQFVESYSYTYPAVQGRRWSNTHITTSLLNYSYFLTGKGSVFASPAFIVCPPAFNPIYGLGDDGNTLTYLSNSSIPNALTYLALVANDQNNPALYSLLTEDGVLSNYQGNIWRLALRYVKFRGR